MSEPSARLKQALSQVRAPWDAARTERTLRGLPARRRRRQLHKLAGAGVGMALALSCTLWLTWVPESAPLARRAKGPALSSQGSQAARALQADGPAAQEQHLLLPDGSHVELLEARTDVVIEESRNELVALRLSRGRARFQVSRRPMRLFRVRTAQVSVEVLGTVFEVTQVAERTWVQVEHGRVAVAWADQRVVLGAGEADWFPRPASEASPPAAGPSPKPKRALHASEPPQVAPEGWRDHAERGEFKQAFPLLPGTEKLGSMQVSELLLAADAARLSGHPKAALPFLERVIEAHPADARAPLAAFTLGGVLMNQLGMPREAEAAYREARATTQSSALAQDALARQVEAAHRAGDESLARRLATEYLQLYPDGRRVHAVRRFGGL